MPERYRRVYWDANVFLAYLNGEPEHMPILDALLDESRQGNIIIVTSMVSMTEVAFAATEKAAKALDPAVEEAISNLFADREVVRLSEYHELIARDARRLIRDAIENGWSLKPMDAIHLATARRLDVAEFHTFDQRLQGYGGPLDYPIHPPRTNSPRLPLTESLPLVAANTEEPTEEPSGEAQEQPVESPPAGAEPPAEQDASSA